MKLVLPRPPLALAPVAGSRHFGHGLLLAMSGITWLFAHWAQAKPWALWSGVDIASESAVVLMLALWLTQLRAARPGGPTTTWLCLGLAGMLLGGWSDLMDEFWKLPREYTLLHGMESALHLVGMTALTRGLQLWRREQLALNARRQGRERGYRDHEQLDGLTQLGDAAYLTQQLRQQQRQGQPAQLVMLGFDDVAGLARRQGLAESDRLLRHAGQLLLLQLRPGDLLCRYAADRFVALLPADASTSPAHMPADLHALLSSHVHACANGQRERLPARMAQATLHPQEDPEAQLLRLLERLR